MGAMRLHVLAVSMGLLVAACAPVAGSPGGSTTASSASSPTAKPAAGYRLCVLDTETLALRGIYGHDWTFETLALSPNGAWLYGSSFMRG